MLKQYKKVSTDNRATNQLQENVEQALDPIISKEIIDGVLHKSIALITGQNNIIEHKLGRPIRGWFATRKRADSRLWDTQDTNTNTSTTLSLNCSANVTIDLWVF